MPAQALDLTALYESHARQVWRMAVRLGVAPANVEDAVQEVFLIAHRQTRAFAGRSSASTWLIGIAVKVAATYRRKQSRGTVPLVEALAAPGRGPDEELEQRQRLYELEDVLRRLPPEQREIVVLCDLEQLTAPEVAEVLEVNVNTVYSRLRLGRAALTRALTEVGKDSS
ncbi:MAG: sigma-70 family RNA polymerase sigma factor [Myxococcaceae bacterium]|nr:sigma-70 family RNA polymerase sigma factor [Myxococcaceae bacterium]